MQNLKPLGPGLPTKLFVANGQLIFISSSTEVNLNIENANFSCNVLVARDLSVSAHLILGTDFLQIHKAILNFDDHTLTLDEDIITSLSIKSDTQDLLSLTDLTNLEAGKTTMVKVKTPSRFNRKTIMVSPIKPFLREGLIVERSINQPDKCGVYIMLINVSKDCIYLPRGMNIAYGEVVDDWDIRAITDTPPRKLHNVSPTPTHQTNIIDFSDTPRRDTKLKSLSANAKPFIPNSNPAMEIMTPSKEQKIEMLEKLGLNLKECKIDEQTIISLTDLLYEYRDVFDVDNPPKDPYQIFHIKSH